MKLLDPAIGLKLVIWGGWILAALGALKFVVYLVGEIAPGAYSGIRSEAVRKFLTGKGNRLLFGLGGFLTFLLGLFFVVAGLILARLQDLL